MTDLQDATAFGSSHLQRNVKEDIRGSLQG